eukprot:jgi/Bigna1/89865/estExt_fgenesh1_pg.C_570013
MTPPLVVLLSLLATHASARTDASGKQKININEIGPSQSLIDDDSGYSEVNLVSFMANLKQSTSKPSAECKTDSLPDFGKAREEESYCCPHVNSNFAMEQEARRLNIGKPKSGKGAIVILAQNKKHEVYYRDCIGMLKKNLDLLYKNYNNKQKDDIIILHEGDFGPEDQEKIIDGRREVSFMTLDGENWAQHPASGIGDNDCCWAGVEGIGYRKMMRWYAIRIWPAMKAKGYKYVARFDDDSYLLSEIPYNLFGFMEHFGINYGYRNVARETGLIWPRPDQYNSFIRDYSRLKLNGSFGWLLDTCEQKTSILDFTRENCGEQYGFYNNFFIANIDRFLEDDVQSFLSVLDNSGNIFVNRWNDLIIQSTTVQLLLKKQNTFHFTGWSYAHNSGFNSSLHYGILQVGKFNKNPVQHYYQVMDRDMDWSVEAHQHMLYMNNGILTLSSPAPGKCCAAKPGEYWPHTEDSGILTPNPMIC